MTDMKKCTGVHSRTNLLTLTVVECCSVGSPQFDADFNLKGNMSVRLHMNMNLSLISGLSF